MRAEGEKTSERARARSLSRRTLGKIRVNAQRQIIIHHTRSDLVRNASLAPAGIRWPSRQSRSPGCRLRDPGSRIHDLEPDVQEPAWILSELPDDPRQVQLGDRFQTSRI